MTEPSSLIVDGVIYFHQNDEATFFGWLDRMAVIADYVGYGDGLRLRLSRRPTDDDLRELLAFHQRYGIDMRPLAAFKTIDNADWFSDPIMYWHTRVFGYSANDSTDERIKIVEKADGSERVVVCRRADGNFTYRRQWADASVAVGLDCGWGELGPELGIYDTPETAEREARQRVPWLTSASTDPDDTGGLTR